MFKVGGFSFVLKKEFLYNVWGFGFFFIFIIEGAIRGLVRIDGGGFYIYLNNKAMQMILCIFLFRRIGEWSLEFARGVVF
jgi:hypothetical protein